MKGNNIMKKLILSLSVISAITLAAAEIPCNGNFEKCKADKKGTLMPEGWVINHGQTRKAEMQLTNDDGAAHGGKFAFDFEVEKGGQAFIMYWKPQPIKPGDKLTISAFAKGTGSFQLGYILYGVPEGGKNSFLWTSSLGKFKPVEAQYKQFKKVVKFQQPVKNGKKCSNVVLIPVIIVDGGSTLLLDDYSISIDAPVKK